MDINKEIPALSEMTNGLLLDCFTVKQIDRRIKQAIALLEEASQNLYAATIILDNYDEAESYMTSTSK